MVQPTPTSIEERRQRIEGAFESARAELGPHDGNALQLHLGLSARAGREEPPARAERQGADPRIAHASGGRRPARFARSAFAAMGVQALQRGYLKREFSVTEVVSELLEDIAALNPELKAFSEVFEEGALGQAAALDKQLAAGTQPSGLFGVPVGIKDIIDVAGCRTTLGSEMYADNEVAREDAAVVRKLRDSQAVLLGKNSTHELAFGATSDSRFHGPVLNPHDPSRVSGGSSGGSASAVAAGLATLSIGTDTGGSIRIPAAICGVVGLKATCHAVSTQGVWTLGFSLDHVGPLGRSLQDVSRAYAVIRETPQHARPGDGMNAPLSDARRLKVGVPESWLEAGRIHEEVWAAYQAALGRFEAAGADIVPLPAPSLPDLYELVALNRLFIMAEGSAQYGHLLSRSELSLTPEIVSRLHIGNAISAPAYINAQRIRKKSMQQLSSGMASVDVVALPTLPALAPRVGEAAVALAGALTEDVREALVRFTAPISVTGHPALSVPIGFTTEALPLAIQLVGHYHEEETLFRAAGLLA